MMKKKYSIFLQLINFNNIIKFSKKYNKNKLEELIILLS